MYRLLGPDVDGYGALVLTGEGVLEVSGLMFPLVMLVGLLFYGFLLWLAWVLVWSVKGIHTELIELRREVARISQRE